MTLSQSALVAHPRPPPRSDVTFCWSASHSCRFDGAADVVDADALVAAFAGVGGAAMPADPEDDATTGSGATDASAAEGVSLVLHAYKKTTGVATMVARSASLFNRAP